MAEFELKIISIKMKHNNPVQTAQKVKHRTTY